LHRFSIAKTQSRP